MSTPETAVDEPGRRRPWVLWPLRLVAGALGPAQAGLSLVSGFMTYRLNVERWYEARPDDIFIVSYPKSGTTLMQMLLYQLTTDGEMGFSHIEDIEPWFEVQLAYSDPSAIAQLPSPRVFKSHYKQWMLPRGGKKIYIVRNLSDVALSAYHHDLIMSGVKEDLGEHLDRYIDGRASYGSWYKHVKSWWPHRNDPDVLLLRYEEVTRDIEGTARRVAAFCGLPLREEQIPRIVERCGIAFMKKHNNKFDPRFYQASRAGEFIRKGQTGGGALELSAEQRERLAKRLSALAREVGCPAGDPLAGLFQPPA